MQSPIVMAFRKRLKKRGYTEISIKMIKEDNQSYIVSAIEPLAHQKIIATYSIIGMCNSFKW